MDQKLLNALDNLSIALEMLVEALQEKDVKSPTATAMQSGDFGKQLETISKELQEIKSDQKKILDNTETILKMQKEKSDSKTSLFEDAGGDKKRSMLKDGVSVIALIAGAVLAIGLAFKLIGDIPIGSVISIAIALPLLAMAFEKISKMKDLTPGQVVKLGFVVVAMATSVFLSSLILSGVSVISPGQLITIVLIAGTFALISFSMEKLMTGVGIFDKFKISPTSMVKALVGIATAITASSWIMNMINPVSFSQGMTAIIIAATFAVISLSMKKIMKAVGIYDKFNIDIKKLVFALVGISTAITASSWIMNLIAPISFSQGLTAIFIAGTFTIISFFLEKIMIGVTIFDKFKVSKKDFVLAFVSIATAITASSWILSLTAPVSLAQGLTILLISLIFAGVMYFLPEILGGLFLFDKFGARKAATLMLSFFGVISASVVLASYIISGIAEIEPGKLLTFAIVAATLSITSLMFGVSLFAINKMGGPMDYLKGGLSLVIIAGVIALSSHIIAMGKYEDGAYPKLDWALGVGLSLLSFSITALSVGAAITLTGGLGAVALGLGLLSLPFVASSIVAVSKKLNEGEYGKYPSLGWSLGVGLSLAAFVPALLMSSLFSVLGGEKAIERGKTVLLSIADSIVEVAEKLSKGKYVDGPTKDWAEGISLSLGAFSPIYKMLMMEKIMTSLFGEGVSIHDFNTAIGTIANGIVASSFIFASAPGNYVNGPPKAWAEGVGLAIGAFAPVYEILSKNSGWFKSGVKPEDFAGTFKDGKLVKDGAIQVISRGIISAAEFFSNNKAPFEEGSYPSKRWGEGVGSALSAFAPVFSALQDKGFFTKGSTVIKNMVSGIVDISTAIIQVANNFSESGGANFETYPKADWGKSVSDVIKNFMKISKEGEKTSTKGLISIWAFSKAINKASKEISKGTYSNFPKKEWVDGTIHALQSFRKILKLMNFNDLYTGGGIMGKLSMMVGTSTGISKISSDIELLSKSFDKLGTSMTNFSGSIQTIDAEKMALVKGLMSNITMISLMDSAMFDSMMDKLEERGGIFVELMKDFDEKKSKASSGGGMKIAPTVEKKSETVEIGKKIDALIAVMSDISSVVGSSGTLNTYLNSIKEPQVTGSRSDKRLKNIIKLVGKSENGINIYQFTYKFNPKVIYQGVIAQELIGTMFEEALIEDKNGFYSVDYNKIDVDFKKISTL